MKIDKQLLTLECLECGKYKVENGSIYFKVKGVFKEFQYCTLPTGYQQVILSNNKRGDSNISVRVYRHIVVYLATHGVYPEGFEIDHIDGNLNNCHPGNLQACPPKANIYNRNPRPETIDTRPIRGKEIDQIRELNSQGHSQSYIAKQLGLNRLSVRYTIKNIEAGKELKYEGYYK